MICFSCGTEMVQTSEGVAPPHHAKLVCPKCGRFGERRMHPYKIWCSEMKRHFPKKRKCEPIDLTDHPFLLTVERTT